MKYFLPLIFVFLLGAGCAVDSNNDELDSTTTGEVTDDMLVPDTDGDLDDDTIVDAVEPEDEAEDDGDVDDTATTEEAGVSVFMKSGNFFFEPDIIKAKAGQKVNITFTDNSGSHTFVIDEIGLKETIPAKGAISFTAPTTPGHYEFYCDVGSHKQLGMKGTLVVE